MNREEQTEIRAGLAAALAPEEVRPGLYVSILHVVDEYMPWAFECGSPDWRPTRPVRVQSLPCNTAPPMKVVDVCLPFVLVELPTGKHRALDVRRYRLARVSTRFGRSAFEHLKPDKRREKKDEADDHG